MESALLAGVMTVEVVFLTRVVRGMYRTMDVALKS